MTLKVTKTPLLIAAIATAITLTGFAPANANTYWASADTDTAQVIDANFKLKVKKHKAFKHHGYKHHSYKRHAPKYHGYKHHGAKKKHVSKHHFKKKLVLKKFY